jgi:cephalosporin hydroxylase
VYLDADHSKAGVLADLKLWMPKVRPGGVIAGHDYLDGDLPEGDFGVRSAVLEFFGREPEMVTGEQWPSWLIEVTA